jgi:hypothetical protein
MNLANMNVQVRGVSKNEMNAYSDKWVGQRVRVRRTGDIKTVVHAQMLMGEDLKLEDGSWVSPWEVQVITE